MKKQLLLFGFIGLFGASVNAQLELTEVGSTTLINGTTINADIFNTDVIHLDVLVKNTASTNQIIVVSRKILTAPSSTWSDQVCWGNASGGTCVDTSSLGLLYNQNYAVAIMPGATGLMNAKIQPDPLSGAPALYRYYFGTQSNQYMDSVDLNVTSVLAVKGIKKDISLSVSPNPASDKVLIQVSNFETGNLKIVDVLGNVVLSSSFSGSKTLNLEDFKNGVYFIMISGDGMKAINRKLVVRH